jgi:hypothetical protein
MGGGYVYGDYGYGCDMVLGDKYPLIAMVLALRARAKQGVPNGSSKPWQSCLCKEAPNYPNVR